MNRSTDAGRLFIAAPLTAQVRQALAEHLHRALEGRTMPGRVVPPDNWHITLRFLGNTDWSRYERLLEALAAAPLGEPFELGFGTLGAFPRPERARVLWLGTERGVDRLRELARVTEECAVAAGFEPERRRFSAHLTLSRLRPARDVRELVAAVPPFEMLLPVQDIVVYRSHLGPGGARYEPLNRFELAAGKGAASQSHPLPSHNSRQEAD